MKKMSAEGRHSCRVKSWGFSADKQYELGWQNWRHSLSWRWADSPSSCHIAGGLVSGLTRWPSRPHCIKVGATFMHPVSAPDPCSLPHCSGDSVFYCSVVCSTTWLTYFQTASYCQFQISEWLEWPQMGCWGISLYSYSLADVKQAQNIIDGD